MECVEETKISNSMKKSVKQNEDFPATARLA